MSLRFEPKAVHLSERVCKALARNGIRSWDQLVAESTRTPNSLRALRGVGTDAIAQIIGCLEANSIDHTIPKIGARGSATPRR